MKCRFICFSLAAIAQHFFLISLLLSEYSPFTQVHYCLFCQYCWDTLQEFGLLVIAVSNQCILINMGFQKLNISWSCGSKWSHLKIKYLLNTQIIFFSLLKREPLTWQCFLNEDHLVKFALLWRGYAIPHGHTFDIYAQILCNLYAP